MKRFLKNILLFNSILLAYFLINFSINKIIISNNPVKLKGNTVVMGDSHTMTGINPKLLTNTVNISQTAEPYIVTYYKLKHVVKHNRMDTLMLGFSFQNIASFNDKKVLDPFWCHEVFDRTYSIISLNDLKGIEINYSSYARSIVKNMLLFPKLDHQGFIGNFRERKTALNLKKHNVHKTIDRHFELKNSSDAGISATSISYLDSIITLCQHKKITLVLISTPLHYKYRELIPKTVESKYYELSELIKKKDIRILDFSSYTFPDNYFADFDHLNTKGADVFTKMISPGKRRL
jgi:hypothetical protein